MPAISVRDIAGEGRRLLHVLRPGRRHARPRLLDSRQRDAAASGRRGAAAQRPSAYLFKPATGVRVRFATNDPTPWPPEVPAGENPPPGALIDYYLPANASGEVKLEILNATGQGDSHVLEQRSRCAAPIRRSIRRRTTRSVRRRRRARLRPSALLARARAHAFERRPACTASVGTCTTIRFPEERRWTRRRWRAVAPCRIAPTPAVNSPWAPPGAYTVRLTADGKSHTQPITVKMDPRVKTPAAVLTQLAALTRELYDGAVGAARGEFQARALVAELDKASGADVAAFKSQVDSLAPAPAAGGRGGGRWWGRRRSGGAAAGPPTLESASAALLAAAMAMQSADVAPTASQIANATRARDTVHRGDGALDEVEEPRGVAALNAKLKAAGQPAVVVPK